MEFHYHILHPSGSQTRGERGRSAKTQTSAGSLKDSLDPAAQHKKKQKQHSNSSTCGVVCKVQKASCAGTQGTADSSLGLSYVPCEPVVVPEGGHASLPRNVVEVIGHHEALARVKRARRRISINQST